MRRWAAAHCRSRPTINNRAVLIIVGGFLLFVAVAIAGLLLFLKTQAPAAFAPRTEQRFPAA